MNTTVVSISIAFINVVTRPSIALEPFQATAHVGADGVIAECVNTTGVCVSLAFIDIMTRPSITLESFQAIALEL